MGEKVVFFEFLIALCMGLGALAIFIWSVLSGHLDETEDIKYRILEREREDNGTTEL
jgi:cbb3-type cytochrome oxidase maturation protein